MLVGTCCFTERVTLTDHLNRDLYEMVVEFLGEEGGAKDFALEIANEYGCKVLVNKLDDDGMVLSSFSTKDPGMKNRPWRPVDTIDRIM